MCRYKDNALVRQVANILISLVQKFYVLGSAKIALGKWHIFLCFQISMRITSSLSEIKMPLSKKAGILILRMKKKSGKYKIVVC